MCGIAGSVGAFATAAFEVCLSQLVHRGENGFGAAFFPYSSFHNLGDARSGLMEQFFPKANLAIGHVRYPTTGTLTHVQPFMYEKKAFFAHSGQIQFIGNASDSHWFFEQIVLQQPKSFEQLVQRLQILLPEIKGAFSCLLSWEEKLLAFQDHEGRRPLFFANLRGDWLLASETYALSTAGGESITAFKPGTLYLFESQKPPQFLFSWGEPRTQLCLLESIYLSNASSQLHHQRVSSLREEFGKKLGHVFAQKKIHVDGIIPIPNSSFFATKGFAEAIQAPIWDALKKMILQRTFLTSHSLGKKTVFQVDKHQIQGKSIVIVDDSLIRGRTLTQILPLLTPHASSIHIAIASPIFDQPCHWGVHLPHPQEFIANHFSTAEYESQLCKYWNLSSITHLTVNDMLQVVGKKVCTACFRKSAVP